MRWTDVPAAPPGRALAAWRAATGRIGLALPDGEPAVLLEAAAFEQAWAHVAASRLERGGLLLGEPLYRDDAPGLLVAVHVRAAVPGLDDAATAISLQLNAAVWDAARAALQPGEVVVGWFHSHPGIGAFFSATDRRTQAGFFNHAFSLGWVIDPQRREQAWFVGADSAGLDDALILRIAPDAVPKAS
jgi:proteasome lid subunit RPN8/RPN11